jgi:tetraacyldisaccharide 4'-kinase
LHPGIISRGYGATDNGSDLISVTAKSDPRLAGDEPVLIARRTSCPVWVGRDRVAVAHALLEHNPGCDIIISDDGLQHYRLQRDFEIAVMDGGRKFGNAQLLPAGPLREPESRIETVDAVIINGLGEVSGSYSLQMESMPLKNLMIADQTADVEHFQGKDVHAIAGIGNPDRFFSQLEALGLLFKRHRFEDHHAFSLHDLQSLDAEVIVMTEKDAVKCAEFAQSNWWCLPVSAVIDSALLSDIVKKLNLNPA